MEPKQLAELPLVFQVIAGFGLFFGTFMLAIGGWLWKTIKPKLPESVANTIDPPAARSDVVLQSATIADSASIRQLAASIDRLIDFIRDQAEDDEHQLDRNRRVLCEIRDIGSETRDLISGLDKHLKGRTIV